MQEALGVSNGWKYMLGRSLLGGGTKNDIIDLFTSCAYVVAEEASNFL